MSKKKTYSCKITFSGEPSERYKKAFDDMARVSTLIWLIGDSAYKGKKKIKLFKTPKSHLRQMIP